MEVKTLHFQGNDLFNNNGHVKTVGNRSLPTTSRYAHNQPNTTEQRPFTAQTFPVRSSKNPYFARNNPHPSRVRHIKGLLDAPVCSVDSIMEETPRSKSTLSLADQERKLYRDGILKLPINFNAYRPREKAIPSIGLVPATEDWRDQLRRIALASGLPLGNLATNGHNSNRCVISRQQSRNSQRNAFKEMEENYVRNVTTRDGNRPTETTRAELCSRTSERPRSHQNSRLSQQGDVGEKTDILQSLDKFDRAMEYISAFPDNESYIFQMLGRILQTDSPEAVRTWLVSAPDREKEIVVQMIQAVTNAERQPNQEIIPQETSRSSHEPIYEDQLLQYESSIDVNEIKSYQNEEKKRKIAMEQKLIDSVESARKEKNTPDHWIRPGTSDPDSQRSQIYEWSVNSIGNKPSTPFKIPNEQLKRGSKEAEIEEIRSKLASSQSVRVFSHQNDRTKASRASERSDATKPNGKKSGSTAKGFKVVGPFLPAH